MYEEQVGPRRERHRVSNTRKANNRVKRKRHWGEGWKEWFDPGDGRLRDPAEEVLQGLPAM